MNSSLSGATFSVNTSVSGQVTVTFHSSSGVNMATLGSVRLGNLTATVPTGSAASIYGDKDLLHFSSISTNAAAAVATDAVHVVAYLGDTNADGKYTSADFTGALGVINSLVTGIGLAAYPVADPTIIADINSNGLVDATDSSLIFQRGGGNTGLAQFPTYVGFSGTPSGFDPALSIPTNLAVDSTGTVSVPVNIDDPRPAGSAGLTSATLAIEYDPQLFTVNSSDIHLGTVPAAGWNLQAVVDQATGQIGVTVFGVSPITSSTGGSLVTIDLHRTSQPATGTTPINLASDVIIAGQGTFTTELDGVEGRYIIGPAPTNAAHDAGVDGSVQLGNSAPVVFTASATPSVVAPAVVASAPASAVASVATPDLGAASLLATLGNVLYVAPQAQGPSLAQQLADRLFQELSDSDSDLAASATSNGALDDLLAFDSAPESQLTDAGQIEALVNRLLGPASADNGLAALDDFFSTFGDS